MPGHDGRRGRAPRPAMTSARRSPAVMPALIAGIHAAPPGTRLQDVDGRDKPGHDGGEVVRYARR